MSKKLITVFGATGKQGGSVVQAFLNDPKLQSAWTVRGVSRNAESDSAKKLSAQGVEVVSVCPFLFFSLSPRCGVVTGVPPTDDHIQADLDDKPSLVKAMNGSFAVFAMTNYWEKMDMQLEIDQGKRLADAAKETGVQHYIWSSLLNVNKRE